MLIQLANLHKLCFPQKSWSADEFAKLKNSGAEIIASENGFIVWRAAADECEIITIGTRPDARGQGIAGAMLALMERDLPRPIKIFLEVAADNAAARALYEKNGYRNIGIRSKYYDGKTDAVVMEKQL
ncbi:MAG: GNAT family N-acetyltransferase [Alphaproteobacteria bacterium]|nr:GNAT family N-acetyltransferase [Alphaproteobacteria bacterium]